MSDPLDDAGDLLRLRLDSALAMIPAGHPCRSAYSAHFQTLEIVLRMAHVLREVTRQLEAATGHSQTRLLDFADAAIAKVRESASEIEVAIAEGEGPRG